MRDIKILKVICYLSLASLPILFKKYHLKDWLLTFFIKAYYSQLVDSFVVANKKVTYPIRVFPKIFNTNIAFNMLLFPIACVIYNRITSKSNVKQAISRVFILSIPITLGEIWFEKNTKLIKYHNGWKWYFSFISLTFSFWLVRLTIEVIRRLDKPTSKERIRAIN